MKNYLIVVDMQKDFVDGSLGTKEAQAIVGNVVKKIEAHDGPIYATLDTHSADYLQTAEGKKLPVEHCVKGTPGWQLNDAVAEALARKPHVLVEKPTFGSVALPRRIAEDAAGEEFSVELIGLCTDICVISNALLLKANFPEVPICVDASCCAGVTPEAHDAALTVMKSCQIDVLNG